MHFKVAKMHSVIRSPWFPFHPSLANHPTEEPFLGCYHFIFFSSFISGMKIPPLPGFYSKYVMCFLWLFSVEYLTQAHRDKLEEKIPEIKELSSQIL